MFMLTRGCRPDACNMVGCRLKARMVAGLSPRCRIHRVNLSL